MQAASLFKYGVKRLQTFFVTDEGYAVGFKSDGTAPDVDALELDTEYHALVMTGYVSSTPAAREIQTATDQADGKNYGDIDTGITAYGNVELTLSQKGQRFIEAIRRVSANTTLSSGQRISSKNNTSLITPYMGLIITDLVRDEDTGELLYEHEVYSKGRFEVTQWAQGNQNAGTNPSPLTIVYKPVPSNRLALYGMLYSALDLGVDEDMDTSSPITSPHELTITTYIKDGTATTFNTKYKPTVTGATVGGVNVYTSQGVQAALTSLTTAGLATMTSEGTSGHIAQLAYATGFKAA